MIRRGLFIADGSSDLPLARHLETICSSCGAAVEMVDVPADRLPGVGRRVDDRLRAILAEDPDFDIVFVHRDSEGGDPSPRYSEVTSAASATFTGPAVAVVPVRMTEAWLLLDEEAIDRLPVRRQVKGTCPYRSGVRSSELPIPSKCSRRP